MTDAGLRILVVGGQAEDVRVVDAGASPLGLTVAWIEPAAAPTHLNAGNILLVVLDLDHTGLAVARVFREHRATRHTPLLFLTEPTTPFEVRARGYALGPSDCLTRPLDPTVLR